MRLHFAQLQDLLDNCGYEQGIITWPHINESENFYEANTGITLSQALGSRIHILLVESKKGGPWRILRAISKQVECAKPRRKNFNPEPSSIP